MNWRRGRGRIKFFAFVSAMRILGQWIGTVGNLFSS